jgi:hypothetical protein
MAADIYLRRNMLLVVFGALHFCLIWHGDILFDYGQKTVADHRITAQSVAKDIASHSVARPSQMKFLRTS